MFVLRLLLVLAVVAVAGGVLAYLVTANRRYLTFSWRVLRYSILVALVIFALLIAERLIVIPL